MRDPSTWHDPAGVPADGDWWDRGWRRRARRRWAVVDVAARVGVGFVRHGSGRNAAVLAYWGFLTVFPLLMVATAVLGFVLEGRPDLQDAVVDSAIAQLPVIGGQVREQAGDLGGNGLALGLGLAGALWGATRAFGALQVAFDDVWEVPPGARPNALARRVRSLVGIVVIGGGQAATVAVGVAALETPLPLVSAVLLWAGAAAVNAAVLAVMYRHLTVAPTTWRVVLPGALAAGVAFTALQAAGTVVVTELLDGAQTVYGAFASVFAVTAWLSIHATVGLLGAELNAQLRARRG